MQELVLDYVRNCRRLRDAEFGLYRGQPTLRQAIRAAALSRMADGTLHPHQRTASSRSLDELSKLLLESEADIARCTSFDELHSLVRRRARGVRGIGELTVYDVALRIGVWPGLNLEPDLVFLPSRTRGSLKALGVEQTGRMVEATAFPSELAPLRPREITDLLCAFREVLPGAV